MLNRHFYLFKALSEFDTDIREGKESGLFFERRRI